MAADSKPATSGVRELQQAFNDAAHDASISDDLDPAYALLGIAETANQQNFPQIAAQAATAFADLVKRVTAKAVKTNGKAGSSVAEDALDQFVDLRATARTANLPLPQAVLDDAMTTLFPLVAANVQKKIDTTATWPERLEHTGDLGDLQASATQILKDEIARDIGTAFDQKVAQLRALADADGDESMRARMVEELAKAQRTRDDRVADAKANNINIVAASMQSQGDKSGDAGTLPASEIDVPEELAAGTASCIETGFAEQQDASALRNLRLNCINSGRLPAQHRCSTANLAFLCYSSAPGSEKVTYVYRGTPEEIYFQHKCGADQVLSPDKVPATGVSFRTTNAVLGFTCAPPGSE